MTGREVEIICIEDTLAATSLRGALEYWGIQTRIHFIATASQLVSLLSQDDALAKTVVLACHGTKKGLCLPLLAAEIEMQQPYKRYINAQQFSEFLSLSGCTIINTGCTMGTEEYARVFLEAGCKTYIGAKGYPEGSAALFYVLSFFYYRKCEGLNEDQAHVKTFLSITDEDSRFSLFSR